MYSRLLVPLDGSATSRLALAHAQTLARLSGARVTLLHVIDELRHSNGFERPQVYIDEVRPRFLQAGQALLDEARQEMEKAGVATDTLLLESEGRRASELIVQQAAEIGADVIVLGTHGRRGMHRWMLGSDAEQVARTAPVPVMLVRPSTADVPEGAVSA